MHESALDTGNPGTMSSRSMIVNELKQRVERREYQVDCRAVAEAFIANQKRCWYPATERLPVRSRSLRPAGPSTTRPNGSSDGRLSGPHAHSS